MIGETFGRWTVVERAERDAGSYWRCVCECGSERAVAQKSLRNGKSRSCGCLARERSTGRPMIDLAGQTFGRLVAIEPAGRTGEDVLWLCRCECGATATVRGSLLRKGKTQSCGCLRLECHTTHGMTHTPEYQAFHSAKKRCTNPHPHHSWVNYGGRGIEFRFESFEQWLAELGPRPSDERSVDRIDVNGHYEPGNVRWATAEEQAANKRGSKIPFSGTAEEAQRVANYLKAYEARRDAS